MGCLARYCANRRSSRMTAAEAIRCLPPPRHFIEGKYVEASGGTGIEVRSPASGELLTTVPDATRHDIDRAVGAARASFEAGTWRGKDPSEKERILLRVAE